MRIVARILSFVSTGDTNVEVKICSALWKKSQHPRSHHDWVHTQVLKNVNIASTKVSVWSVQLSVKFCNSLFIIWICVRHYIDKLNRQMGWLCSRTICNAGFGYWLFPLCTAYLGFTTGGASIGIWPNSTNHSRNIQIQLYAKSISLFESYSKCSRFGEVLSFANWSENWDPVWATVVLNV